MSTERPEWPKATVKLAPGRFPMLRLHNYSDQLRGAEGYVPQSRLAEVEAERDAIGGELVAAREWVDGEPGRVDRTLSLLESDEVVEAVADGLDVYAPDERWMRRKTANAALQAAKHAIQKQLEEDGDG